jgi:hypothetical protein
MITVYTAGKYTGTTEEETKQNIKLAKEYAVKLWDLGYNVICPQANTALFEKHMKNATYDTILDGCIDTMMRCDAVFFLPNWKESKGALKEFDVCKANGIFTCESFEELHEYSSHADNPRFQEMRKIMTRMYNMSISKNKDYSPLNILTTGETGILTRLMDKVMRLCNLMGLDITKGEWKKVSSPNHESIDDNILDLANYSLILMIYRAGKWAKWTDKGIE